MCARSSGSQARGGRKSSTLQGYPKQKPASDTAISLRVHVGCLQNPVTLLLVAPHSRHLYAFSCCTSACSALPRCAPSTTWGPPSGRIRTASTVGLASSTLRPNRALQASLRASPLAAEPFCATAVAAIAWVCAPHLLPAARSSVSLSGGLSSFRTWLKNRCR